jgi:RNA polymerase sigma-70 factor, ECF subfamily
MIDDARRAAERSARQSYGKLVAYLASRSRDVPAAEDALCEALATALRIWPERGVPDNPDAWLLVAARRNLSRETRHRNVGLASQSKILVAMEEVEQRINDVASEDAFPDDRLKLLFACTHPAIDPAMHAPLMLQVVLGVEARNIAATFLVSTETMAQRLVRAKNKIRDAGIPFAVPEWFKLSERLSGVLPAIYAAYGLGWDSLDDDGGRSSDLTEEAIWLACALLSIMPGEPEVLGLLSLMLYCEARRNARRDASGSYVPLEQQDVSRWNEAMNREADELLEHAGTLGRFGPFQCQAAIQSVHAARRMTAETDWAALETLYAALIVMRPTAGALVSRAAIIGRTRGAEAGLASLDLMDDAQISSYQPYWAVRAHLLNESGARQNAIAGYDVAIGLSASPALRQFLMLRRGEA